MFRLRYASGEEAIFRSIDELALGLRSGIIGADTYVLDTTVHVWQPLVHHPLYQEAAALAATLSTYGELDLEPVSHIHQTPSGEQRAATITSRPVYQMASISGGELRARRNQQALMKAGMVLGAVLLVATSGFVIWRERGRQSSGDREQRMAQPVPHQARQATPTPPGTAFWLSPGILASRREDAQARLDRALTDSSTRLWWEDLVSLARLRSADSLRIELERLRRWRGVTERYRQHSFDMLRAYQDTANAQVHGDQWSLLDVNDWKSRPAFVEGPSDAMRVDSLLSGLEKLYELLLAQAGRYQLDPVRATFTAYRAEVEYSRLAGILRRHGSSTGNGAERVSLPLALLRQGLDGSPLPPVPVRADQ
jgi:hypothetical protein